MKHLKETLEIFAFLIVILIIAVVSAFLIHLTYTSFGLILAITLSVLATFVFIYVTLMFLD